MRRDIHFKGPYLTIRSGLSGESAFRRLLGVHGGVLHRSWILGAVEYLLLLVLPSLQRQGVQRTCRVSACVCRWTANPEPEKELTQYAELQTSLRARIWLFHQTPLSVLRTPLDVLFCKVPQDLRTQK